ncbi:MAG: hypothetical protein ED557_04130 [Balneola sp.]|nr:MAG: hypothetical protein ED557_04130 [Balneola sp.]
MGTYHTRKLLMICLLVFGCNTTKPFEVELIRDGGKEEAIENAILDFSNTTKMYNKYQVFRVNIKYLDAYNGLILVMINENFIYLLETEETVPGSIGKMPSRFIEKDGKLFLWWDNDYALTAEALAVYEKYDILQDDENGLLKLPEIDIRVKSDGKSVRYFFCEDDLTKYKKVVSDRGFIERPNIKCD